MDCQIITPLGKLTQTLYIFSLFFKNKLKNHIALEAIGFNRQYSESIDAMPRHCMVYILLLPLPFSH